MVFTIKINQVWHLKHAMFNVFSLISCIAELNPNTLSET